MILQLIYCITYSLYNHIGCMFFWGKFGNALLMLWFRVYYPGGAIIQCKYPNSLYFDLQDQTVPYSS